MLARAQAAGQVRADLAETDVALVQFMLTAIADITREADPDVWRRYLRLVLDGLRAGAASEPMPVPPLPRDALDAVVRALPAGTRGRRSG
jgi:transcriptional regulator SbtR-like protein